MEFARSVARKYGRVPDTKLKYVSSEENRDSIEEQTDAHEICPGTVSLGK